MADIFFSPLNQFRFVPNTIQVGDKFNTNDFDEVLYPSQKQFWQQKKCFFQPVQKTDGLKIIFNAQSFVNQSTSSAHLISKDGGIIKTIPVILSSVTDGSRFYYYVNSKTFFDDVDDGIYAIVLELYYRNAINPATLDSVYYYSDALDVRTKHNNTLWIQYNNYYSKLGIPFERLSNITNDMGIRVYGSRTDIGYTTERTVFDDQNNNPMQLKATANRLFSFYFGGDRNQLPDYLIDKLNQVFTCSTVLIDNVEYVPSSDSAFEKEGDISSTLYGAKITLAKKDNLDSYNFEPDAVRVFNLFDLSNNTYPYAIDSVVLSDRNNVVINPSVLSVPTIIQNVAQRTAYVTMLNNSLPISIVGRFAITNNVLTFTKEESDNVFFASTPSVHQKCYRINMRYSGSSSNDYASFTINNAIFRSELTPIATNNTTYSSNLYGSIQLSCPSAGDYYCLVFANDTVTQVEALGSEFVSIESLGNDFYGYASDSVYVLDIHDTGDFFAQPTARWFEGYKVSGDIVNSIELYFSFRNSYSFPSLYSLGRLGFSSLFIEDSGMTTSQIDDLYNELYNVGLSGDLYPNITQITTINNAGTASSNSLIARNYLTQVLGINITI